MLLSAPTYEWINIVLSKIQAKIYFYKYLGCVNKKKFLKTNFTLRLHNSWEFLSSFNIDVTIFLMSFLIFVLSLVVVALGNLPSKLLNRCLDQLPSPESDNYTITHYPSTNSHIIAQ